MLRKSPTGGQEAIRIFNKIVRPLLDQLWGIGLANRFRSRIKKVYKTIPHNMTTDENRRKLKEVLERIIIARADDLKKKISSKVTVHRDTVTVDIEPVKNEDPPKDEHGKDNGS